MASRFLPPPGSVADTHDSDLFPAIVAECFVSIGLTSFFAIARLIAKKAISKFHIEDYLLIAACVLNDGFAVIFLLQGFSGFGKHIWDMKPYNAVKLAKLSWAVELMYCVCTLVAKIALLLHMQRVFAPMKRGAVYIACQTLLYLNLAFYGSAFISLTAECVPTQMIWSTTVTKGHCINNGALLVATGVVNIISDLTLLILPAWAIYHINMAMKMKIGVSAVFATGVLAFVCSVCRLVYTFKPLHDKDATYLFAPLALWSLAEVTSIILVTCFPLMPIFFRIITGKPAKAVNRHSSHATRYSRVKSTTPFFTNRCGSCDSNRPCDLHDTDAGSIASNDGNEYFSSGGITDDTTLSHQRTSSITGFPEPLPTSFLQESGIQRAENPVRDNRYVTVRREYEEHDREKMADRIPKIRLSLRASLFGPLKWPEWF